MRTRVLSFIESLFTGQSSREEHAREKTPLMEDAPVVAEIREEELPCIDVNSINVLWSNAMLCKQYEADQRSRRILEEEKIKVEQAILDLRKNLEESARKGCLNCAVIKLWESPGVNSDETRETLSKLMDHPAYGRLMRYMLAQSLDDFHLGFGFSSNEDAGTDGNCTLYVRLPV